MFSKTDKILYLLKFKATEHTCKKNQVSLYQSEMSLLKFNKDQTFCINLGSKKAAPISRQHTKNVWFQQYSLGELPLQSLFVLMLLMLPFLVPEKLLPPHPLLQVSLTVQSQAIGQGAHSGSSDAKMRKINFNAQKMELLRQKVTKIITNWSTVQGRGMSVCFNAIPQKQVLNKIFVRRYSSRIRKNIM